MNNKNRLIVWNKYGKRCAYCGKAIKYKEMQVDHIIPKNIGGTDDITNLNPSCRRCNHYKRTYSIEQYRQLLITLHERIKKIYINKVGLDYGIIKINECDGKFYFEKELLNEN
jgi:5-methylcytosine-specific restriction endonuclease McrA